MLRSGAGVARMAYRLSEAGVEIRRAGRTDWIPWDELWDAAETRRSYLLCPAPGEQYVIPKRCCDADARYGLRAVIEWLPTHRSAVRQRADPFP